MSAPSAPLPHPLPNTGAWADDWRTWASPAAMALGPRWIESGSHSQGLPCQTFALSPASREAPWCAALQGRAVVEPVPYRPMDEATLAPPSREWLWTLPDQILVEQGCQDPSGLAGLLLRTWRVASAPAPKPRIMAVLNTTPDSFSDGGRFLDPLQALERAQVLRDQGAHILDIGGQSTRPGAPAVSAKEEWQRVGPVIEALTRSGFELPISIDTTKAEVARRALQAGAQWVNDISAGTFDADMLPLVAEQQVPFIAMHCPAPPERMQQGIHYGDVVRDVAAWLRERMRACKEVGIEPGNLCLDPGIGFGKHLDHNLSLLRRLWELRSLGCPLLLGVSRKSFIAHLSRAEDPTDVYPAQSALSPGDRLGGTAAALVACVQGGASILRVHDVATMAQASMLAYALHNPEPHPH